MGCTAVRLVHYPHAQQLHNLMDRRGLIAWAEIPFVNVFVSHPLYRENLKQQLVELICQYYNHPCILTWGLLMKSTGMAGKSKPYGRRTEQVG